MNGKRLALLTVVVALIAAFFVFDRGRFLSLDNLRSHQAAVQAWYEAHPWQTVLIYFGAYVVSVTLSVPGATVLTLAAGAIFGVLWGTVIVSFASSIGATLAFLASRYLFRDAILRRFGDKLRAINTGVERDGPFYLFTLRMIPVFPFFAINLFMGLTPMKTRTFYWVSQTGMLLGTIVYVNAGTQIAKIHSLHGILSPALLISFALLGIFPLAAKRIVAFFQARRVYAKWPKPARFDRNLVVIGGGSAGLVAAYIGAAVKAKVTLIEKHRMGGDCLNTGCIPSKALIRSAKLLSQIRRATNYGIHSATAEFDFAEAMERVQHVIETIQPHDSVERYTGLGVECIHGEANITSPWSVEVTTAAGKQLLTARSIVIAAGAQPFVPPIPGIEEVGYVTSDSIWSLRVLPKRLVVLGGGPIGCELAQCFARFGSQVTQVEMLPRIMIREDPEISERVMRRFREDGITVLLGYKAKRFRVENGEKLLIAEHEGQETRIVFDVVLVAVGRIANTTGYGLEELGIGTTRQHTVETDEYLATVYPNIYACGDVAGPYQFTHVGSHQAWYASVNALFGVLRKFRADYSVIPWATFTDPEVARVGLNETEAKEKGIACEVTTYDIEDLDRAIADGEASGLVKVLTVPGKDKILGATIVGEHAGDLITEYVTAMKYGIGMNKILGTIHIYPTLAEANKYAAGNWKRAHVSARTLRWLDRYHAWMRG
jgi:dihydrolipoamide dehydrogenase